MIDSHKPTEFYLSGPMGGDYAAAEETFVSMVTLLRDAGITVKSPHEINWDEQKKKGKPAAGVRFGLNQLTASDGIILFGEWRKARGCLLEVFTAVSTGSEIREITNVDGKTLDEITTVLSSDHNSFYDNVFLNLLVTQNLIFNKRKKRWWL